MLLLLVDRVHGVTVLTEGLLTTMLGVMIYSKGGWEGSIYGSIYMLV